MSGTARELLEEYREDYGVSPESLSESLSESEIIEYQKYIEIGQLKEIHRRITAIQKIIAYTVGIFLILMAVGCIFSAMAIRTTNAVVAFASFVCSILFGVFGGKALSLRN